MNIYQQLGITYEADETAIKRAYAARIKQYRPDTHPAEFAEIRQAYEAALRQWKARRQWEEELEEEPEEILATALQANTAQPSEVAAPLESMAQPFENPAPHEYAPEETIPPPPQVSAAPPPETPAADEETFPEPDAYFEADTVAAMMDELEAQAGQDSEEEMLQRYRAQSARVAALPLDQQMDYEQALCYWLLFSDNPPLLAFREANQRYGWAANSIEIVRLYGREAGIRVAAIKSLAEMYAEAREAQSPFLKLDGKESARPVRLATHYSVARAKEQSATWKQSCEEAGLPELLSRVACTPGRNWQVFWADGLFGLLGAGIGGLFTDSKPAWIVWLVVVLFGLGFLILPTLMRAIRKFAKAKMGGRIARIKAWLYQDAEHIGLLRLILILAAFGIPFAIILGLMGALYSSALIFTVAFISLFVTAMVFYTVLAKLEAGVVETGVKLARFAAWLRTPRGKKGKQESEWNRAKSRWKTKKEGDWQWSSWWVYGLIVFIFQMIKLAVNK